MLIAIIFKRLISGICALFFSSLLIFTVLESIPGDPARIMLGMHADEQALQTLRTRMGLHLEPAKRYSAWISSFVTGDMGTSLSYSIPVVDMARDGIQVSLPLATITLFLSIILGVWAGCFYGVHRTTFKGTCILIISHIAIIIPSFWLAFFLIETCIVDFNIFSSLHVYGWESGILSSLSSFILPIAALLPAQASFFSKITRSSLQEILNKDYIRTAQGKGLNAWSVVYRHALPNAALTILPFVSMQFAFLLSGLIVIENIFCLPGLGRLIISALEQRDFIVIKNISMMMITLVILVNMITDCLCHILDPRLYKTSPKRDFV